MIAFLFLRLSKLLREQTQGVKAKMVERRSVPNLWGGRPPEAYYGLLGVAIFMRYVLSY